MNCALIWTGPPMADQRTEAPPATETAASLATQRRGRADPFAHGALPMRPNYLPEEDEGGGNRSELWSVAKALLIAAAVILVMGWLLARSA